MKIVLAFTFCFLFLLSCNEGYKFWDVSHFNLVDTAVKDNDEVKLLYSSRGPNSNGKLEYYIQIIAVLQKNGDTVNILTPVDNGFTINDKDKVFNYFDQNNLAYKLILMNPDKLSDFENIDEANNFVPKKIKKVARDPKFDNLADNRYPTVIGSIGTMQHN